MRAVHQSSWSRQTELPCDRLNGAPREGHFIIYKNTEPILSSPASGYRLNSKLGSCMLVDDQGQYGDIGYPMSIPSWKYRDARIVAASWNEKSGTGAVELKLHPAYPKKARMIRYMRTFVFQADGTIICRDMVVLKHPRKLSWLFHANEELSMEIGESNKCLIAGDGGIGIEPITDNVELVASLHHTTTVKTYVRTTQEFKHVRYDTIEPVSKVCVDFIIK